MIGQEEYSNFLGACLGSKRCQRRRESRQQGRADKRDGKYQNSLGDAALKQAQAKILLLEGNQFGAGRAEDTSDASASASDDTLLYGGIAAAVLLVVVIVVLIKKKKK